ncbi:MAG: hypothetical protein ACT4R6_07095 [Gemmatimonadaceae bacterium]
MRTQSWRRVVPNVILLAAVVACGRREQPAVDTTTAGGAVATTPVTVASVDLGKAVDANKKVTAPMTSFGVRDTIFASVSTTGSGSSATLTARWTYQDGQVVNESTESIAPAGSTTTEFHISKASAWPAGSYKVEILLNGTSVASRDFEIK